MHPHALKRTFAVLFAIVDGQPIGAIGAGSIVARWPSSIT